VATARALKMHGGAFIMKPGKTPDKKIIIKPNRKALIKGCDNLKKQIENVHIHGIPCVVAINRFPGDIKEELEIIKKKAIEYGAEDAVISEVWEKGGLGGIDLGKAVIKVIKKPHKMRFLYNSNASIKEKIERIATKIYGAKRVKYSNLALKKIRLFTKLGFSKFPINMAKTHHSISHDANLKGAPIGYVFPIRDIKVSAGGGYVYPLAGTIRTMPALPSTPAATRMDIDKEGNTIGLF
jgi:formate--tetrahydrofolate ligase